MIGSDMAMMEGARLSLNELRNLLKRDHLFRGSRGISITREEERQPWAFSDEGQKVIDSLLNFAENNGGSVITPSPMTMDQFVHQIDDLLEG